MNENEKETVVSENGETENAAPAEETKETVTEEKESRSEKKKSKKLVEL